MSNRNGPQVGKSNQARRHAPEKFAARYGHPRNIDRANLAARKDNAGKIGARFNSVVLTYYERGSSALMLQDN